MENLENICRELWLNFHDVLTTDCSFRDVKPYLTRALEYFKLIEDKAMSRYIFILITKEDDVNAGEWDNVVFMLHEQFEPKYHNRYSLLHNIINKLYGGD